jgi:hypothetical protein
MELSLAGLIGGAAGLVMGLVNFAVITELAERRLRAVDRSETPEECAVFERKIALFRRIIFGFEVVVLTATGYYVGITIGGWLKG